MIKPFDFYLRENLVKRTISNVSLAKALLEKGEIRFSRIKKENISEKEYSLVFEDIYESLREASQSLMEIKGFKPYSHEALISFLNEEKFLSPEKVNIINNYRILRNNSVYKAEQISKEKCFEALKFAEEILPEIKQKFKELK